MQLSDLLAQMGGLESMSRQLGIDQKQAASGVEALLPAILGGFSKQAQQPGGLGGLGALLGQPGSAAPGAMPAPPPAEIDRGNDVLGQIFGSKDVSRAVAQNASTGSGLDPALLKKMLPLLAMLVAGFMARQGASSPAPDQAAAGGGGLGGLLGGLLGGGKAPAGSSPGGLGALGSLLDANGDGNVLDDILRMAGKTLRR